MHKRFSGHWIMANFGHGLIPTSRLAVSFALIVLSGCVSLQEQGSNRDPAAPGAYPAVAGDRQGRALCKARHIYVCERQFRTRVDTCHCTPESAILQSEIEPGRLF
jgi:hypothetical protein